MKLAYRGTDTTDIRVNCATVTWMFRASRCTVTAERVRNAFARAVFRNASEGADPDERIEEKTREDRGLPILLFLRVRGVHLTHRTTLYNRSFKIPRSYRTTEQKLLTRDSFRVKTFV